ncbi:polyphosphate polymerase domain-containing protein [Agromyces seonyuensis]|uniref:VTC domain-containing protein n=1 Tax=Agromyces seonyuensis TaxID=2662446 RepID=A0A6I4P7F1_9MICO|nr:polyphosphate polymerase domain-containing protein [Agromyces seonyuensis]MWB99687.1 VTC domain-containing protein [Agromyces seonyuensis]
MSALARLAALPPVDLVELNERAELQTRIDRKYLVPLDRLPAVLVRLDDDTRVLEIGGARDSAYESVYFDTPDLLSYRLAATARRRRFKIRTRSYLDSELSFLEVKTRGGRAATVKGRVSVDPTSASTLEGEALAYAEETLAETGVTDARGLRLEATLVTRYRRATLLVPATAERVESRATIDVGLEWVDLEPAERHEACRPRRMRTPHLAIVETKSAATPGTVDRALWAEGLRPARVSKFATGLAALHPELPSNRWHRTLVRHFADATFAPASAPTPDRSALAA